jgi:hypothetical protein
MLFNLPLRKGCAVHRVVACLLACALLVLALTSEIDPAPPAAGIIGPLSAAAEVSVTDADQTAAAETQTAAADAATETNTPEPIATDSATETATSTPEPTETGTPEPSATSTATAMPTNTATTVPTKTPTTIPTATATPIPGMSLSASSGNVGSTLRVQVRKFRPNSRVAIYYDGTRVLTLTTDQYGTARDGFIVPRSPAGAHTIRADGALSKTASATFAVKPLLKLNVGTVLAGRSVTATVTGFGKSTTVAVRLYDGDLTTGYRTVARLTTSSTGTGSITFTVPSSTKAGTHTVLAVQSTNRDDTTLKVVRPTNTPTPTKTATPRPLPTKTPTPRAACDPSYPTVCIPPPPPDLDCSQIPYRRFKVLQPDPHGFDRDRDGIGCES